MQAKSHALPGLIEFIPRLFGDPRGVFYETYSARLMQELGLPAHLEWVQDNQSKSQPGVVRGLHFQRPPHAQAKLVRVAHGSALDVVVDIRRDSPTFGQHATVELSAALGNILFVPIGFAHGFVALEEDTLFLYKCSDYYAPAAEGGLLWNDPALNINWGVAEAIISPKDAVLPTLAELDSPF
ncbi:dTDP-4-dehydrorhamnose 3,5-epimerase [Hymenobacter convexus]|uniref:dTDP-4-dehydrorhamnose 3,5-epimerase n=1 Tax=Hymenobacter sp. CA1UV-4 TaxID=3063782 RepID=UPI0027134C0C|nr:dTDP-4-dehydrorhamnose 3,5-epimerase [Hymenobacter sp. CA1UV-4]MDO7854679.1 dTDP-4-dehydrorhamnose 3,5-epimerase [Hymenobacter sp. CA1UV-4]